MLWTVLYLIGMFWTWSWFFTKRIEASFQSAAGAIFLWPVTWVVIVYNQIYGEDN